ncbi:type II secretion system protein GspK [Fimbriiglobus ruber]|nr:type II secretion system protein GspK [Fimbriiglobus ruber]
MLRKKSHARPVAGSALARLAGSRFSFRGKLRTTRRVGFALIAVLIVVSVLSLAAYRFAESMTSEYQVAVRTTEAAQAKTFAASGVHYVAGMLADPNTFNGTLAGNPYDNQGVFANVTVSTDGPKGGGRFSLIAVGDTFTGTGESRYMIRYGVTDEAAKINVNSMLQLDPTGNTLYTALMTLPNMTPNIADSIVDWVDSDEIPRTNGSESSYYQGLSQPYRSKNAPLNSLDELLLVNGVTPQLLYGNDRNRNGKMDTGEADGNDFGRGWSEFLTPYGRELDVDINGNQRINLNDSTTDPNTQSQLLTQALGQAMSDYIMAARMYGTTSTASSTTSSSSSGSSTSGSSTTQSGSSGSSGNSGSGSSGSMSGSGSSGSSGSGSSGNSGSSGSSSGSGSSGSSSNTVTGTAANLRTAVAASLAASTPPTLSNKISSIGSLFSTQVSLPQPANAAQNAPTTVVASPLNDPTQLATVLPPLLDATTPRTTYDMVPRVNVNMAPPEVLTALPGLTAADVATIVNARGSQSPTDPATTTGAWIFTQAGIDPSKFAALEQYITGKTMTYRVHSVGYFASNGSIGNGGAVARVEAVIDTNQGTPRFLYYRDVTDLGRGFDLPR